MRLLDRKLLRELYQAKGLLLAITSIIAVGISCYVAMQSAYHNLSRAKTQYYRQCRMADFWIDVKKVPVAELQAVASLPGVTEIQSRIQFFATVDLQQVSQPLNGLVISLPDRPGHPLCDIVPRRGGYFTDRRANEVIVNDAFARQHRIYPGQWIHVLLNDRRQELFVVGTAISSEFTYLLGPGAITPDPESFGVFYVKRTFAEDVYDFQGAANQIVGRLAPEKRDRPDDVLRRAETLLEPYGVATTTPLKLQASNHFLSGEIEGLGAFASVVPTIFLAVAALVLNVLINRLARQQRTVVGTLKALGYSDPQVFFHFLKYGLSVGIAGGLAGSILGYLFASGMTIMYRQFFEFPQLDSGFYWYTHAVGLSVSLICAIVGTFHGARTMLRLRPAEAMRPEPPRRGRRILLERITPLWNRLDAAWRMALRSVFRQRFRTAAAVFAAAMGSGLLVTGFMMLQAMDFLVEFQFFKVARSDIDLVFKQERGEDALDEVRQLVGVDYVEPTLHVPCTFLHGPYRRKGGIYGLKPDAQLTVPIDVHGHRVTLPEHGLLLSRQMAKTLHVGPGQSVEIVPVRGERRPIAMPVVGVVDGYMGLTVYARIDYLSQAVGEEFAVNGVQLLTDNVPGHRAMLHHQLKRLPGVQSITARQDMVDNLMETIIQSQSATISVIVGFAGVVFFGSVVNASLVSLAERRREVATFRGLGYDTVRVGNLFLRETMITTLVGAVLGMPFGYGLTVLTAMAYNTDLIQLPVVTAPWIWLTTAALAVVFALIAHAVVQWRIATMNFVEALKVQE